MVALKDSPSKGASEAQLAEVPVLCMNPIEVSIQDPSAVLSLRWYHECNGHGDVLKGFQNSACKEWFYLPTSGEIYAEPVELVSNHAVIEAVQMKKVIGHVGVW